MKELCMLFVSLEMDVVDANVFQEPQTPEQVKAIIDECKNEYQTLQDKKRLVLEKQKESENKIYYSSE
ncbi:TPA: hypothetical protein DEP21_04875 [Patescibacteria group bacterium]|nr:hypothetical protein [Candidatus Gracilibacteria bacterium]